MRVRWTDTAFAHLQSIHGYIAQDSPAYARRVVDRITERSRQIGMFPLSGRLVPEYSDPEVHEVFETSYRIIYRVQPHTIDVLAVIHMAQQPRSDQA